MQNNGDMIKKRKEKKKQINNPVHEGVFWSEVGFMRNTCIRDPLASLKK